ncbi:hypothetical protein HUJ04_003967 [Dendroctonus ponderosae]|uniref:Doublecortin domain-containing protein n=1 Tax=Dendroctonus ponderosae TaxID=77166 RepID=A0AAR5P9P8_DENPD|nr:hypothetical protein HUJ04_003967 [Dendroctonus ponderosae]
MENSASSFQSNYAIGIKRIYVWENGDFNGNGSVLVVNSRLYRSWTAILTLITSVLKPTFGTVRNLVCLSNREFVRCFESLESNGKYVALGTEKLKQTKDCYKTAKEKQNLLLSTISPLGVNCDEEIGKSPKGKNDHIIIFVLANGTTEVTPCKIILTDADLRSWDAILNLIAQRLDIPAGIQNLFTPTGDAIKDPRAFRNGDIYVAVAANEEFINLDYSKVYPYIFPKKETAKNQITELGKLSQIIHDPIIVNVMQKCNYNVVSKSRSDGLTNINSSNRYGPICSGTKRRRAEAVSALDNERSENCTQWTKDNSSTETLSEIECPNIQRNEKLPRKPVGKKKSIPSACLKSSHNFGKLSVQKTVNNNVLKCRNPCPGYRKKTLNSNKQPVLKKSSEICPKLQPAKMVQPKGPIPRSISEKEANNAKLEKCGCLQSSKTQHENIFNSHKAEVSSCQFEHNRSETSFSVDDLPDFCCRDHSELGIEGQEENVVLRQAESVSVSCEFPSIKMFHKSVDTGDSALTKPKSKNANVGVAACEPTFEKSTTARSIQCKLGCCRNVDRKQEIEEEISLTNLRVKRESGIPIKKSCCHSIRSSPAKIPQKKPKRKCILSRLCSKIAKQPDTSDACTESYQEVEHESILNCPAKELKIQLGRQRKSKMCHETCSENAQLPMSLNSRVQTQKKHEIKNYSANNTTCICKHKETATKSQIITQKDLQMDDDVQRSSNNIGESQLVVETQQTRSLNSTLKFQCPSVKRIGTKMAEDMKSTSCKINKLKTANIPTLSHSKIMCKTSQHCGCDDIAKTECSSFGDFLLQPGKSASSKLVQSQSVAISLPTSSIENIPTSSKSANIPSCSNVPKVSYKGKLSGEKVSSKTKSESATGRITCPLTTEEEDKEESASAELKAKKHFCTLDSCVLKEKKVEKRCISRVHSDSSGVNIPSACGVEINSIISKAEDSEVIMPPSKVQTITKNENEQSSEVFSTCMNSCGSGKLKRVLLPAKSRGTDPIKDLVPEYRQIGISTDRVPLIEEHSTREQKDVEKCCSVDEKWIKIVESDNQEFSQQTFIDIIDDEKSKSRETGNEYADSEIQPTKVGNDLSGNIERRSCNHVELRSKSTQTTSESATRYATSVVAHLISGMKLPAYNSSFNEPQLNKELKVIEATVSDFETLASANLISDLLENPKVIESILSGKDSSILIDRKSVLRSDKTVRSAVGKDVSSLKGSPCNKFGCYKRVSEKLERDHPVRCISLNKTAACPSSRISSQHQPAESVPSGMTSSFNQKVPSSKKGSCSPINLKCPSGKSSTKSKTIHERLVGDAASEKELKNVQARKISGSERCIYLICTNKRPQGSSSSNNPTCSTQVFAGQKNAPEVQNEPTAANIFSKTDETNATCCTIRRLLTKPKIEELECPEERSDELTTENKADIETLSDREVIVETPSGFIRDIIDKSVVVIDRFNLKPRGFAALGPKEAKCPERKNQPSQGCCSCPNAHASPNNVVHENFEYRSIYPNRCDDFDKEKQENYEIGQPNVDENRAKLSPCVTTTEQNSKFNLNLTNLFKDYAETPSTGSPASQNQDSDDARKIDNDVDSSPQNENRRVSIMLDGAGPMVYSYIDSNADSQDAISAAMLFEQFRSEPESSIPSTITVGNVRPMLVKNSKARCKPPEEADNVSKAASSIPSPQTLSSSKSHRTKCFCKEKGCNCMFECFGNLLHSISDHPVKPADKLEIVFDVLRL